MVETTPPFYIVMFSVHGLIRAKDPELGRDADTGGQVLYVLELVRALARCPEVAKVDLITRLIQDPSVGEEYSNPQETIAENARLIRIPFGPKRYLRKELLWEYLDQLIDRTLHFLQKEERLPDLFHSHYADAGYVGVHLSELLGIPLVHTGHSLGRVKRQRLLADGRKPETVDRQFHFPKRIAAEEAVLKHAELIVTSTRQEIEEQYALYQNFHRKKAVVIPPGTDASRFSPPSTTKKIGENVRENIDHFLRRTGKPLILAIARPDERKNLVRLVEAYGSSQKLQEIANLAIVAGNRDDIQVLPEPQKQVLTNLLYMVDFYDLYGKVALPKKHTADQLPDFYRLAAMRKGVFVNPALTEPFGLTLIEAAASGLPIVATADGGPRDIVANCRNGLLVDPLDTNAIADALLDALSDRDRWRRWVKAGLKGIHAHYTWEAHVRKYLKEVLRMLHRERKQRRRTMQFAVREEPSWPVANAALIPELGEVLLGDQEGLEVLLDWVKSHINAMVFGLLTSRSLENIKRTLRTYKIPTPDVPIAADGTEIYYGSDFRQDLGWHNLIRDGWRRTAIHDLLTQIPGVSPQRTKQSEFRLSFRVSAKSVAKAEEALQQQHLSANLFYDTEKTLIVLPYKASPGRALRYLSYKWSLPLSHFLVAAGSFADLDFLRGDVMAVVPKKHDLLLEELRGHPLVYFAKKDDAWAVLEGIEHYRFEKLLGARRNGTSR
jgi:sucrose-phosphate synthase